MNGAQPIKSDSINRGVWGQTSMSCSVAPPMQIAGGFVFICYARADNSSNDPKKRWLDRLLEFLHPLVRYEKLLLWSDKKIKIGEAWHTVIQRQLDCSKVAVLLISPAFLASDYIARSELPVLLKHTGDRGLKILPVIISPCLYEESRFRYPDWETGPEELSLGSLQSINPPSKTLDEMTEAEQNREFLKIAQQVVTWLLEGGPRIANSGRQRLSSPVPSQASRTRAGDTGTDQTVPNLVLSFCRANVEKLDTMIRSVESGGMPCLSISVWNSPAPAGKFAADAKSMFATVVFIGPTSRTNVNRAFWVDEDASEVPVEVGETKHIVIGIPSEDCWVAFNNPNKLGSEVRERNDPLRDLEPRVINWGIGVSYAVDVRIVSTATGSKGQTLAHKVFKLERTDMAYTARWLEETDVSS